MESQIEKLNKRKYKCFVVSHLAHFCKSKFTLDLYDWMNGISSDFFFHTEFLGVKFFKKLIKRSLETIDLISSRLEFFRFPVETQESSQAGGDQ